MFWPIWPSSGNCPLTKTASLYFLSWHTSMQSIHHISHSSNQSCLGHTLLHYPFSASFIYSVICNVFLYLIITNFTTPKLCYLLLILLTCFCSWPCVCYCDVILTVTICIMQRCVINICYWHFYVCICYFPRSICVSYWCMFPCSCGWVSHVILGFLHACPC
jgi:hypothetical protein